MVVSLFQQSRKGQKEMFTFIFIRIKKTFLDIHVSQPLHTKELLQTRKKT